jgi:hypothetical protein
MCQNGSVVKVHLVDMKLHLTLVNLSTSDVKLTDEM